LADALSRQDWEGSVGETGSETCSSLLGETDSDTCSSLLPGDVGD